jgi:transposase
MVGPEVEAAILRLYHVEKWRIETIARHLDIHHSVVRRVLAANGVAEGRLYQVRPSMVDPFVPFIRETLERYPRISASRLYEMVCQRGHTGSASHFRHLMARLRPRPKREAYLHLRTLPGEQAQVDWAHFGTITIGQAIRRLSAFVMILSWSRRLFVRFFLSQKIENFLRGHAAAFDRFGGVVRTCLYDNLRSVVLERIGDAIRFHPLLLQFAGHYRYEPRPVAPYRANEKGRVESSIHYLRQAFFTARRWRDLDDLNAQVLAWCEGPACDRPCPGEAGLSVRQAFELEQPKLLALPETPFPTEERLVLPIGKFPYVRFDLNDYSVPHDLVDHTVTVLATLTTVRVLRDSDTVATHERSYDKGQRIEDPAHLTHLVEAKRRARQHRATDQLRQLVPSSATLLSELALKGLNLGSACVALLRLLEIYGHEELEAAVAEALRHGSPHPHSVRQILHRRDRERGLTPSVPVRLSPLAQRHDRPIPSHDLKDYDELGADPDPNDVAARPDLAAPKEDNDEDE